MDYEKKYNEALERARKIHNEILNNELLGFPDQIREIFPELRESEDERIRKWLADYFNSIKKTVWIHRDITCEQILAYLEKQKEQKPAEWSEEDERMLSRCVKSIESSKQFADSDTFKKAKDNEIDWLENRFKSLRPSWKPSEEQLNALNFAITYFMHETNYKNPTELRDLYDDLLKLK